MLSWAFSGFHGCCGHSHVACFLSSRVGCVTFGNEDVVRMVHSGPDIRVGFDIYCMKGKERHQVSRMFVLSLTLTARWTCTAAKRWGKVRKEEIYGRITNRFPPVTLDIRTVMKSGMKASYRGRHSMLRGMSVNMPILQLKSNRFMTKVSVTRRTKREGSFKTSRHASLKIPRCVLNFQPSAHVNSYLLLTRNPLPTTVH